MAIVPFKFYFHSNLEGSELTELIADATGLPFEEVEEMDLGEPFYEIGVNCALDTDEGEVMILGVAKEYIR